METKLEINSLESLRTAIIENISRLRHKIETDKDNWVIAGYGGETMYAYVGIDKGYMGACLVPCSSSPLLFNEECEAEEYAKHLVYTNGRMEPIRLKAMTAPFYYSFVIIELEESIKAIDSL